MTLYRKFEDKCLTNDGFEYLGHYMGQDVYLCRYPEDHVWSGTMLMYFGNDESDNGTMPLELLRDTHLIPSSEGIKVNFVLAATMALARRSLDSLIKKTVSDGATEE